MQGNDNLVDKFRSIHFYTKIILLVNFGENTFALKAVLKIRIQHFLLEFIQNSLISLLCGGFKSWGGAWVYNNYLRTMDKAQQEVKNSQQSVQIDLENPKDLKTKIKNVLTSDFLRELRIYQQQRRKQKQKKNQQPVEISDEPEIQAQDVQQMLADDVLSHQKMSQEEQGAQEVADFVVRDHQSSPQEDQIDKLQKIYRQKRRNKHKVMNLSDQDIKNTLPKTKMISKQQKKPKAPQPQSTSLTAEEEQRLRAVIAKTKQAIKQNNKIQRKIAQSQIGSNSQRHIDEQFGFLQKSLDAKREVIMQQKMKIVKMEAENNERIKNAELKEQNQRLLQSIEERKKELEQFNLQLVQVQEKIQAEAKSLRTAEQQKLQAVEQLNKSKVQAYQFLQDFRRIKKTSVDQLAELDELIAKKLAMLK